MDIFKLPIRFEAIPFYKEGDVFSFLLVKRVPDDGGFWQPITGTLESNESLAECMRRELAEEVGVHEEDIKQVSDMFYSFTWLKGETTIAEYVFGVELATKKEALLSEEHDEYRWCSYDEALELLSKDNNKKAYEEFKKKFLLA
ncbi:MAG: NUDIX pyrophosphatase [Myxococcaceae bacterium]